MPGRNASRGGAIKIVLTVIGVFGAFALLVTATARPGAEYYKFVDEVMKNTDSLRGKKLQVHGSSDNPAPPPDAKRPQGWSTFQLRSAT